MATAPEDRPLPDQVDGAPHPRQTARLIGQAAAERDFLDAHATGRMHSGWLITGPLGVGKATLAWRLATFLLATPAQADDGLFGAPPPPTTLDVAPDHPDARLVQSGAHPRLFVLRRGWDDKADRLRTRITVDEVRKLRNFFAMSATDGGRRVVIVDAADEMNVNAANAILKLLEEPPAHAVLLLVAHQPSRLLPTIRSRCRELRCKLLAAPEMTAALDQAGIRTDAPEALAALANGSVGEAVRLANLDGLPLYADLVRLFEGLPRLDRPAAIKLAESCAGRAADTRYALMLDLLDLFLARTARAGLTGEPPVQGAPGEARLLTRLSPDARAARTWAVLAQDVSDRTRHGRAVNLDPAALLLDTLLRIEAAAKSATAPA
ncbi:MAG: DNA polymerase III delta' subunit HolB [Rhodobacteraceae bacterium HLUCCA08]|nr:MAG: DNA polymerase III delta' subunit HolB [Rhodobacteraceae bacterium HLUCCA08]